MKRVKVGFGIKPITYDTFAEAVHDPRPEKPEQRIHGEVLDRYTFDGATLVCEFRNRLNLTVSCGHNRIDWRVDEERRVVDAVTLEPTEFELPGGSRVEWVLTRILDALVGKKAAVSPSRQALFIFAKDSPEYMFDFYVDSGDPSLRYLVLNES